MQPKPPHRVGNVYGGAIVQNGDGKITNKRTSFRIGRFDLGLGGLVSLGAVLLVGGGGTVAAVVNQTTKPSAAVRNAVGTWRSTAPKQIGSITFKSITLTVSPAAVYQATVQTKHADDSTQTLPCAGEVTARDDALVFKPFDQVTGPGPHCSTFTATVTDETMTVTGYGDASVNLRRS